MANYCDVEMTITGKVEALKEIAEAASKPKRSISTFGDKGWCEVLEDLGIETECLYLRGGIYQKTWKELMDEITYNEDNGCSDIKLDYESAWCKLDDVHDALYGKYGDDICISYREIEEGCGIYRTNDMDIYPEKFYMDIDGDCDVYEEIGDVIRALNAYEIPNVPQLDEDKVEETDLLDVEEAVFACVSKYNETAPTSIVLHEIKFVP